MKLPRDVSGEELARLLAQLGYGIVRTTGSQIRLTTTQNGEHHVTIPAHGSLRVGTLAAILSDVAEHFSMPRDLLTERLFHR